MDLITPSGVELGRRIRQREVSSREVVEAHIRQIERVNPTLNAVVASRFDEARAEALAADARLAREGAEGLPPFHGVPITTKECFALTGMPHSGGLFARRNHIATVDSTAVARWRAAGCIPLGVTNLSELGMWMESVNHVYGRTSNAYDPTRIAGGSSGGAAAIVAACGSPFGLGSDVGGSIRGPAFYNGVFGHKPTGGLVPNTGQYPATENEALRYLCTGPIARHAEDLWPTLALLAGPDGQDEGCAELPLGDPATVSLAGRTVLQVEDDGRWPPSAALHAAQEQALRVLEQAGCRVRRARPRALERSFEIWSALMGRAQEGSFAEMLGIGHAVRAIPELARWAVGASDHTFMALLLALTSDVPDLLSGYAERLIEQHRHLQAELEELMGPGGLWLYPPYTVTAPRHGEPVRWALRLHMPFAYTAIVNVLELPATQVPLGLDGRGLPLGVQVIGQRGDDHVTVAAALHLERALGGWVRPALV